MRAKPTPYLTGPSVGERIREVRTSRRISLSEISRGTGLSITFLSHLESGKSNVSVDNLRKIAEFLDIAMVQLFEWSQDFSKGVITRKAQGVRLKIARSTAYSESLIRKSNSNIQATIFVNPPGKGRNTPFSHCGEEIVYIVKGSILFSLGDEKHKLRAGDSIYYRSELPHSWVNMGKKECTMIVFNSPQVW